MSGTQSPVAQHCSWNAPHAAKPQNAALGAGLQISVLCRTLRVLQGSPTSVPPQVLCQGWWLVPLRLAPPGALSQPRAGVKSTMGKCPVDF